MLAAAATTNGSHLPAPHEADGVASVLWVGFVLLPLAFALLGRIVAALTRVARADEPRFHGRWAIVSTGIVLCALLALWLGGVPTGTLEIGGFTTFGLKFSVTAASLLFSLFACWLWFLAALFARGYLAHGHAHPRFYLYFLICLTGTLGTFQAGSLLTLFMFFEMVSLGAYPLVIHEETDDAHSAGWLYLFMSVAGGLCVFLGTAMLHSLRGTTDLTVIGEIAGGSAGWLIAAGLLLVGFAVKAGLFPVHIWLPRAHPVAPAPASALLSGVMIKTGAWGIYQVLRIFAAPIAAPAVSSLTSLAGGTSAGLQAAAEGGAPGAPAVATLATALGGFLVPVALLTMFLGASMALSAVNAKRVLAYSSVSQIGYVVLGAALAAVLGSGEAMGSAGFAFHALAHALFKATMFMLIGLIYQKTHELDIRRLGPLARRMPVTAAVFGLCVLGIIGMPGFCGYPSKTVLHDAILILRHDVGGAAWAAVEIMFTLTSAMTTAYMCKLWYMLFLRRQVGVSPGAASAVQAGQGEAALSHVGEARGHAGHEDHSHAPDIRETRGEKALVLIAAVPLLAVGLGYQQVLGRLVLPFTAAMGLSHEAAHHVEHLAFFGRASLLGAALPLSLGTGLVLLLGRLRFPSPLRDGLPSIEGSVIAPLLRGLYSFMHAAAWFDRRVDAAFVSIARVAMSLAQVSAVVDEAIDAGTMGTTRVAMRLVQAGTAIDEAIDATTEGSTEVAKRLVQVGRALDKAIDAGTEGSTRVAMRLVQVGTAIDKAIDAGTEGSVEAGMEVVRAAEQAEDSLNRGFAGLVNRAWSAIVGHSTGQKPRPQTSQSDRSMSNLNIATLVLFGMAALVILLMLFWSGARVEG